MYKKLQCYTVETVFFGKRQRFADEPCEALAERIVPAFDVCGFPGFLAD